MPILHNPKIRGASVLAVCQPSQFETILQMLPAPWPKLYAGMVNRTQFELIVTVHHCANFSIPSCIFCPDHSP